MSEKINTEKFFSIVKNIGGLIELKEYDIKPSDIEDRSLSFLVEEYFSCFKKLKKLENLIYKYGGKNEWVYQFFSQSADF